MAGEGMQVAGEAMPMPWEGALMPSTIGTAPTTVGASAGRAFEQVACAHRAGAGPGAGAFVCRR